MRPVIILCTSVESPMAVSALAPALDDLVGHGNWNFDLQDCDHVLRVVGPGSATPVIELLQGQGFSAAELPDNVPGDMDFRLVAS